jgi:isopentenyl phosphate kinase
VRPTVVKLGGSVITIKEEDFTPNPPVINRLAKEIAEAHLDSMILIHGGGSFGHPVAQKYQIAEGYKTPSQRIGFSKTRQAMMTLNKLVIDAFLRQNLPVVTVQPSACITTKGGRIQHFDVTAIQHLLRLGFIPVLYGDVALDLEVGFTILSGDQIAAELATIFNAEKTVIAVDVDGLFTEDPKSNPNAKLINEISLEELNGLLDSIDEAKTVDVTKGMHGKIMEIIPAVERGIQIDLVNATIASRLYKALKGEKVTGTKITRDRLR